jgi:hypothetical protein
VILDDDASPFGFLEECINEKKGIVIISISSMNDTDDGPIHIDHLTNIADTEFLCWLLRDVAEVREAEMGKEKPPQGKAPNTGSNSTSKRDNKMSTTEKSQNPKRPHAN